jgi:dolichol kinase
MDLLQTEIKRKAFHHLSLLYMGMYALLPRVVTLCLLGVILLGVSVVEFLRLRRPELNDWFLKKFGGVHRDHEIMQPSGIFWTLLGCWMTMLVFTNKRIVFTALGFLTFGDAAAALGGKRWGKAHWPNRPGKTYAGTLCFVAVAAGWGLFFLNWPVVLVSALFIGWLESRSLVWNDNLWIPLASGLLLSFLNLTIGRFG